MIGYLSGQVVDVSETKAVIAVNGVGYEVALLQNHLLTLVTGVEATVFVYTHSTENALQLFGFRTATEKDAFKKMISISGVGPKMALAILSEIPLNDLFQAVAKQDLSRFTSVSGVGKKTAERLLIELKSKFKRELETPHWHAAANLSHHQIDERLRDASQALESLGYASPLIRKTLEEITIADNDSVQVVIKNSLARLQAQTR